MLRPSCSLLMHIICVFSPLISMPYARLTELTESNRCCKSPALLSLQYHKLHTKDNESTQEWMGRLYIKTTECNYKEHNRRLKEQFINVIDDEKNHTRDVKKLTAHKNKKEIDSEQVLIWGQRAEVQTAQKKCYKTRKTWKSSTIYKGVSRPR